MNNEERWISKEKIREPQESLNKVQVFKTYVFTSETSN